MEGSPEIRFRTAAAGRDGGKASAANGQARDPRGRLATARPEEGFLLAGISRGGVASSPRPLGLAREPRSPNSGFSFQA